MKILSQTHYSKYQLACHAHNNPRAYLKNVRRPSSFDFTSNLVIKIHHRCYFAFISTSPSTVNGADGTTLTVFPQILFHRPAILSGILWLHTEIQYGYEHYTTLRNILWIQYLNHSSWTPKNADDKNRWPRHILFVSIIWSLNINFNPMKFALKTTNTDEIHRTESKFDGPGAIDISKSTRECVSNQNADTNCVTLNSTTLFVFVQVLFYFNQSIKRSNTI